jgi:quercetin dioxygenase-like cupin family protein
MQRRKFLAATVTASAIVANGQVTNFDKMTTSPFVIKNGKSRFNESTKIGGKSPNDIKVSSKDTQGNLTVFEYTGHVKGGPPLHVHPNQDEIFYIIDGKYKFQVGEEIYFLEQGDTIFLPRNIKHAFAQLTDIGKMIYFFQSSGKMEDYFRELGKLNGPPSPQIGAKLFSDHDMKVVGPPLSLE